MRAYDLPTVMKLLEVHCGVPTTFCLEFEKMHSHTKNAFVAK
jgi:hypothetical protein